MATVLRCRGVELRFTGVSDGDASAITQRAVVLGLTDRTCTFLRQEHGREVVVVDEPGAFDGAVADVAVVTAFDSAAAIRTADCVPLAIVGERAFAVVHAGWRGLVAGVIEAAVGALSDHDPGPWTAVVGPCIHAHCYEFAEEDLSVVAARYGDSVRALTSSGAAALDLVESVRCALARWSVRLDTSASTCTACEPDNFSYRARRDIGRQLLVAWRPAPAIAVA